MFETLSDRSAKRFIVGGVVLGVGTFAPLFGLTFQPSWASGWGSWSKHTVFSVGVTGLLSLSALGFSLLLAGLTGFWLQSRSRRLHVGWMTVGVIVLCALVALAVVAPTLYAAIRADMVKTWR